uniref:Uncharacterized protein n=2 Tax=Oryza punctata TaxID=4537 RepID=A0A0E0MH58_ORYPU
MAAAAGSTAVATGSDEEVPATTMAKLRLSQENVDWILARSELCGEDAPDISRYIPFLLQRVSGVPGAEDPLPESYYEDPKALMRHIDELLMDKFDKFRDFERWVRAEHEEKGFVEVDYDHQHFEQRQRKREERRGLMAEMLAEEMADILPTFEDGEFGDYIEVYDEQKREFIMQEVKGNIGVPVFDKEKKRFVFVKKN